MASQPEAYNGKRTCRSRPDNAQSCLSMAPGHMHHLKHDGHDSATLKGLPCATSGRGDPKEVFLQSQQRCTGEPSKESETSSEVRHFLEKVCTGTRRPSIARATARDLTKRQAESQFCRAAPMPHDGSTLPDVTTRSLDQWGCCRSGPRHRRLSERHRPSFAITNLTNLSVTQKVVTEVRNLLCVAALCSDSFCVPVIDDGPASADLVAAFRVCPSQRKCAHDLSHCP